MKHDKLKEWLLPKTKIDVAEEETASTLRAAKGRVMNEYMDEPESKRELARRTVETG